MRYDKQNRENLDKLAPNTKQAAYGWYDWCEQHGVDILIYETTRSLETQRENVAKGASQTMKSYHLVGQALDFVPIVKGGADWSAGAYSTPLIKEAIAEAKRRGFVWGGEWKTLVDKPHLEYHYKGYGTDKTLTEKPYKDPAAPAAPSKNEEADDVPKMNQDDALAIINAYLKPEWGRQEAARQKAVAEGDEKAAETAKNLRDYQNHLANAIRVQAGLPKE